MLIYVLLLIIPFFFCYIRRDTKNRQRFIYIAGFTDENKCSNCALPVFFFILLLMLMCKGVSVGNDTVNYRYIFNKGEKMTFGEVFEEPIECFFTLFNYVFYSISDSFRLYLIAVAAIEVIPIARYYSKDRQCSLVKIVLFVNMSTFVMLFSGIRQSMAVSLGVLAFEALTEDKKLRYWTASVIAAFVHLSGFLVFLLYPLYHFRLKKKNVPALIAAVTAVYAFNKQIFTLLTDILSKISDKFNAEYSSTGAVTMLLLFILFALFSYLTADERKMDGELFALRNILTFAVFLQCFAPLHPLAMRMNYYFIVLIPAAIGKLLTVPKRCYANLAEYAKLTIVLFFGFYFVATVLTSWMTGESSLNTVPYVPFWVEIGESIEIG